MSLIDPMGRRIRKLRVALLDACNFRCIYCMPVNAQFMPKKQRMSCKEILRLSRIFVDLGVKEIRVTGGEPTLRGDFASIMSALAELPIEKLAITSNGLLLQRHLDFLYKIGCRFLNISLDSLDAQKFHRLTRSDSLPAVIECIEKAQKMGFLVKVNCVLMKNRNDDEIFDFITFSEKQEVEVRFLELMKIGPAHRHHAFIAADEVISRIRARLELIPQVVAQDSTSFCFRTPTGAQLGFIASESRPFCGHCSRWRLSADGHLRTCLMSRDGVFVRYLSENELYGQIPKLLAMKPQGRIEHIKQNMNEIGG